MLKETIQLMMEFQQKECWEIEVMLSRETLFVLKYYGVWNLVLDHFSPVHEEKGPNAPFLGGSIQKGKYAFLVIAPVTGNTMAKIAHGIADSLISNCVALGLKAGIPMGIFPTDQEVIGEDVVLRDGSTLHLEPRKVDLENVEKVRCMRHVTVFRNLGEMRAFLDQQA